MKRAISDCINLQVQLRHDQSITDISKNEYQDSNVTILAPDWVEKGLQKLTKEIPETIKLTVTDKKGKTQRFDKNELNLKTLITLSRNESVNVTGNINFDLYQGLKRECVYSIKDLTRQCIIIGMDETTHYGGYPYHSKKTPQNKPVIIVDMIGLQFQQKYNSGRLVLIDDKLPKGVLDDFIFTHIVGETKASCIEAKKDQTNRYYYNGNGYFDTLAYEKFVQNDFSLLCKILDQTEYSNINLKFLKYGTGFFAGSYGKVLENHITKGIYQGIKNYFQSAKNFNIKSFEFPFFDKDEQISQICKSKNIKCVFSLDDALKQTDPTDPDLITATTNCADPHAVTGNEMNYSSVDAAIATNLKSKGCKFSPVINQAMTFKYINLSCLKQSCDSTQPNSSNSEQWNLTAENLDDDINNSPKMQNKKKCPMCNSMVPNDVEFNLVHQNSNISPPLEEITLNESHNEKSSNDDNLDNVKNNLAKQYVNHEKFY